MNCGQRIGRWLVVAVLMANVALAAEPPTVRPAKNIPPVAFVKRAHFRRPFGGGTLYCWNVYSPGTAICIYDPARPQDGQREIFRRDGGVIYDMNPSFDGRKLLFAYMAIKADEHFRPDPDAKAAAGCTPKYKRNIDSFHLYEINVDGTGLRQITRGRFHDVSGVYLPDGRICFVSTRGKSWSMCQPGLASALFTMNADGSDIRRIEFSTLADLAPFVMDNGQIIFMRWEYQDKSLFTLQSLWTINPDGTRLQLFYGNTIVNPNVIWQARQIPGTQKFLCTMGPHHGHPVGAIGIVERQRGLENPAGLVNLTPEFPYTPDNREHAGSWGPGDKQHVWAYRDPWPISQELFLAAYGGGGTKRYRIVTLDRHGKRELLCEDPKTSCFNPIPLAPRKRPTVINPLPASDATFGTFAVQDVYQGLTGYGIRRGQVKAIRIMTQIPKRMNMRGRRVFDHDPVISRGSYYVKGCYGTVPVEDDGSAHFQALDSAGRELARMGSVTQIMPGERQSCVGCHEPRLKTFRPSRRAKALLRPASKPTPPPWGDEVAIDFVKHVQPVFEKYCVSCHSGADPKDGVDLSGDKTQYFNMAYDTLIARRLVHYIWINRGPTGALKPMTTGSHRSKLAELIATRHAKVDMDDNSRRRIYTWIDSNCTYYGTYENTRPGTPGSRDAWAGPWRRKLDAAVKAAGVRRPNTMQVNLSRPAFSAILTANLAKGAGGRVDDSKAKFTNTDDPHYKAILAAITEGKAALDAKPRMDMPGGQPAPYPVDWGGLYQGFAGP